MNDKQEKFILVMIFLSIFFGIGLGIYEKYNNKNKVVTVKKTKKTYYTECLKKETSLNCMLKNTGYQISKGVKDSIKSSLKNKMRKFKEEKD